MKIYFARDLVDMRNGIDGLMAIVKAALGKDPYEGHLFVFVGKSKDKVETSAAKRGSTIATNAAARRSWRSSTRVSPRLSPVRATPKALAGGMPIYKYVANRVLTLAESILLEEKLSEHHSGLRAFSRRLLETLQLEENDDDFVFDNQMLVQALHFGFSIAEVTSPTKYCTAASSISVTRSVKYGSGALGTAARFRLHRASLKRARLLDDEGRRLE